MSTGEIAEQLLPPTPPTENLSLMSQWTFGKKLLFSFKIIGYFVVLVFSLSGLALGIATLAQYVYHGSEIEQLRQNTMDQLSDLQSLVNTLKTTTMGQMSDLQSSVKTLNTTSTKQQSSLQALQSSLNTLTSRITPPVNLYQGCIQNTSGCTVNKPNNYLRSCSTPKLYIDSSDTRYYTMGMRCEYESTYGADIKSATLKKYAGDKYSCSCDVTNIDTQQVGGGCSPSRTVMVHATLSSRYFATCTLIVTRCPRSVNLLN